MCTYVYIYIYVISLLLIITLLPLLLLSLLLRTSSGHSLHFQTGQPKPRRPSISLSVPSASVIVATVLMDTCWWHSWGSLV